MPGIKIPLKALVDKLATMDMENPNLPAGAAVQKLFTAVWNNQISYMEQQTIEAFPFPAAFVEVLMPNDYAQMGLGMTDSDIVWRIHLANRLEDSGNGTIEQNFEVFDWRDRVIALLTYFELPACSGLMKIAEGQDYEHSNVYHYLIDFKSSFIDDRGDQMAGKQVKEPPTDLDVTGTFVDEIPPVAVPDTNPFKDRIPQK